MAESRRGFLGKLLAAPLVPAAVAAAAAPQAHAPYPQIPEKVVRFNEPFDPSPFCSAVDVWSETTLGYEPPDIPVRAEMKVVRSKPMTVAEIRRLEKRAYEYSCTAWDPSYTDPSWLRR